MKKNKNKILIIIVIVILLIISVLVIKMNTSIPFKVENFKHKDTSKINYEYMDTYEDYENRYGIYRENNKSLYKGGKYYSAIIDYSNKQIIIEENVFSFKQDDNEIVKSIIYSKDKINKDIAYDYINYIHGGSCGAKLKEYKKVENGYYYIKYEKLGEC